MTKPHRHAGSGCKEIFGMLSDYLNLELPPATCEEIRRHLEGCPPCIEFANSLRKTIELCRKYQPSEMPAPLGDRARTELLAAFERMMAARKHPS
jgi:RNA polymerase sigma-70 factor (ECF subfamily)